MRRIRNRRPFAGRSLALSLALALALGAALAAPAAAVGAPAGASGGGDGEQHFRTGEELARTVTVATGVPISPLLGVSALGALRWWHTSESGRASLPWYARPWFWGSGLFLVFLFAANTTIGSLVPGLKKPMDFVEEHENKLSALLATPIVLLEIHRLLVAGGAISARLPAVGATPAAPGLAALTGGAALGDAAGILLGALYVVVFFVVFLAFHAIQVLIALSPSALLDLLLRGFRLAMMAVAAAAAGLHPYVGALWGLLVLAVCWLVAGWSFRLTVFGTVCSWEFLSGRDGRSDPRHEPLAAFSGRGLEGVPVRSLGRLEAGGEGGWTFRWRPWLILPARLVTLGPVAGLALLRGAVSPLLVRTGPVREATLARFPPRFRRREQELAARMGVAEVRDGRVVRGLKATWRWLRSLVAGGEGSEAPAA
jgi:hypothetical protein